VVGWTQEEVRNTLRIPYTALAADPLREVYGGKPWEPWAPALAAARFLAELEHLCAGTFSRLSPMDSLIDKTRSNSKSGACSNQKSRAIFRDRLRTHLFLSNHSSTHASMIIQCVNKDVNCLFVYIFTYKFHL